MSSLATSKTGSLLSDFSSSLLNAADEIKSGDRKASRANISGNCNLSSVLSQIQDNGPAYDEATKRAGAVGIKTESANTYANNSNTRNLNTSNADAEYSVKQQIDSYNSDKVTAEDTLDLSSNELRNTKQISFNTRLQFLFIVLFFVIVGVAMYKIDQHVKNSINQTLQNINTNYSSLDHKHEESFGSRLLTKSNEVASITTNVSALTFEIRSLRKELDSVKSNIAEVNANKLNITNNAQESDANIKLRNANNVPVKPINIVAKKITDETTNSITNSAANKISIVADVAPASKLSPGNYKVVVNLASLSDEEKANKLVKKLSAAGLSPLIEKVVVNKKQVYRVSVSGFTGYKEAVLFVKNAGAKYGTPGSWIRKS